MTLARVLGTALTGWALGSLAACSSSTSEDAASPAGAPTAAPTASNAADQGATSIDFDATSLVLLPAQSRKVTVTVLPPKAYTVSLALTGDARDAYLSASELQTDDSGTGTFTLTAPTTAATFTVRAAVGPVSSELSVSEGDEGTTLEVVPSYAGHRTVTTWTATVNAGKSCDPTTIPPPDGALVASAPKRPRVAGVPLGTALTVTLRAGHFVGGCVELESVVPSGAGSTTQVTVPVTDRPLGTDGAVIPVRFGFDTGMAWVNAYTTLNQDMQVAFSPSVAGDATSLLDAMYAATPDTAQAAFTVERTLHTWDEKLVHSLDGDLGRRGLRAAVGRWLDSVLPILTDRGLSGTLSDAGSGAAFTVGAVGGLLPSDVGFPSTLSDVSFTTSSDDKILFGGTASKFSAARLAGAVALTPATVDYPAATSVPDALSSLVDCATVGATLAGSAGAAYSGCTASCVERRCEEALSTMWNRALAVASDSVLDASASADVTALTDDAVPTTIAGTWVGTCSVGGTSVKVGGTADSNVSKTAVK